MQNKTMTVLFLLQPLIIKADGTVKHNVDLSLPYMTGEGKEALSFFLSFCVCFKAHVL